jgi:hypothetical protein
MSPPLPNSFWQDDEDKTPAPTQDAGLRPLFTFEPIGPYGKLDFSILPITPPKIPGTTYGIERRFNW